VANTYKNSCAKYKYLYTKIRKRRGKRVGWRVEGRILRKSEEGRGKRKREARRGGGLREGNTLFLETVAALW
jgi:hypothetical protein